VLFGVWCLVRGVGCLGFGFWRLAFGVGCLGLQNPGCRGYVNPQEQGPGLRILGSGLGSRVESWEFRVQGLGFRVSGFGFGFMVYGSEGLPGR